MKSFRSFNTMRQFQMANNILLTQISKPNSMKMMTSIGLIGTSFGFYSTFVLKKSLTTGWIFAESQESKKDSTQSQPQEGKDTVRQSGHAPVPTDPSNYTPTHPQVEKLNEVLKNVNSIKELDIVLFQYQVCPFCCKVRAFLDKNKIPYRMVEVHPISKSEIKWSQYKKVPIIIVNGVQINDSSIIISSLNRFVRKVSGKNPLSIDETEAKWRLWVDDRFVRVLPPNIYRTFEEARSSFDYITQKGEFSYWQQKIALYGGALAMWGVSKKLAKRYNITDERATLYDCANEWCQSIPKGQPFQGGSEPNLADLAVYGILSSIEGLQAFNDMCENTDIGTFYYRMKENIGTTLPIKISLAEAQSYIDTVLKNEKQNV